MIDRDVIRSRPSYLEWQNASIVGVIERTPSIKSFFFQLSVPFSHVAGQHVDIRLTAPDGYIAMRSYSIASAPSATGIIELAIDLLPNGEVSPFFHRVARIGDEIELRGPIGGHFVFPANATGPVLLIGAGSGVVPLMAMIRQMASNAQVGRTALLLSARTARDVAFRDELVATEQSGIGFLLALALTRDTPTRECDFARRIDAPMITQVVKRLRTLPTRVFICRSNAFVDAAVDGALVAGVVPAVIKTERYGA